MLLLWADGNKLRGPAVALVFIIVYIHLLLLVQVVRKCYDRRASYWFLQRCNISFLKLIRKYPEGWAEDEGRDKTLEYRLSIHHAQKDDSGIYTCTTPIRHHHSVEIIVHPVHCPQIPDRKGLVASNRNTKMGTKVFFTCQNSNALIGAPELTCLPSGTWNAPIPFCESVLCSDITNVTAERILRVSIVSREVGGRALFTCPPGFTIRGSSETICQSNGEWGQSLPHCEGKKSITFFQNLILIWLKLFDALVEVVCEPPTSPDNGYIQGNPFGRKK